MDMFQFVVAVIRYCALTDGSVTSWGRTRRRNAAVAGVRRSPHLFWMGADVAYDEAIDEAEAAIVGSRLGLLVIREQDHDHLQPIDWPAG